MTVYSFLYNKFNINNPNVGISTKQLNIEINKYLNNILYKDKWCYCIVNDSKFFPMYRKIYRCSKFIKTDKIYIITKLVKK